MQNKSAVLLFTILLALAALYTLSFNFVSSNFEDKAEAFAKGYADSLITADGLSDDDFDNLVKNAKKDYLRDHANDTIYPVFGHTYQDVKENELNLGLDLKGGMSVTLEVSIPELINNLSGKNSYEPFQNALEEAKKAQLSSSDDYITLFQQAWENQNDDTPLYKVFSNEDTQDLFPPKASDEDIFATLRDEAEDAISNTENIIRKRIDQFGVAQPNVQKIGFSGRILVELPGVDDPERVRKQLKATANLEFWETLDANVVAQGFVSYNDFLGKQADPVLYARADSLAKLRQANPQDSTIASIDEIMTIEERQKINPLFSLINTQLSRGVILGLATEKDAGKLMNYLRAPEAAQFIPNNVKFAWERNGDSDVYSLYCLRDDEGKGIPKISGRNIVDASASYDQAGRPETTMLMDGEGTSIWRTMTEEAAADNNRQIAIVLDSLVISAPSVTTMIANGSSSISMGSDGSITDKLERATDLAGLLKAGSLPAPSKIVDEVTVGATLGEDNIQKGLMSFIIALLVVLVYMIFYYKGAGVVSDIALIANLFFLIGALAALGAALTLPGIAGIVLTIGMAVDANVLIYERIKEEMRGGKGLNLAVKDGYARAYSAIIDANLTTLLTAIVLKIFGSGPILGFANTLIIGIFTSLFSAIVITRLIFFSRLEGKKAISFYSNLTKDWFANTNFQFVKKRKVFYGVSALIIIAGIVSLSTRSLQLGTDFTGGSSIDVTFVDETVDIEALRTNLTDATTVDGLKGTPVVQSTDKGGAFRITTNYLIDYTEADQDEKIQEALKTAFTPFGDYEIERFNKVSGNISDEFRRGALLATIFALAVIFLYLIFRFRKWQFGLGALIAMVHDVLIVLSLFSIFKGILPFSLEVDLAFIAAILTVIGYSINDTVVVFDRIREYLGLYGKKKEEKEIINDALNSTLSRTINTSISTFIVLLIIFVFGGSNIKGFIFALMVGVVVGTYSSIFIATPSVLDLSKKLTK